MTLELLLLLLMGYTVEELDSSLLISSSTGKWTTVEVVADDEAIAGARNRLGFNLIASS